jgi:hypothetical protein
MSAIPKRERGPAAQPPPPALNFEPIQDPRLRPRSCQVLWALCYWAWGKKPYCWPTNNQIADLIGCCPRTVGLALKELVDAGYVTRHMVKHATGWYRVLAVSDRVPKPTLSMVEPPESPAAAQTPAAPTPAPASPPSERPKEPDEPAWLNVSSLTSVDADRYREILATPGHPMRKIALKVLERWERHLAAQFDPEPFVLKEGTTAPGSPAKDPRGPSTQVSPPGASPGIENSINGGQSGQDKCDPTEHKTH